ncbi:helix-hairpin-helix domain-containing protein [Micromonospora musae]|uniref:helix-hairpin-helix domain-containing protein n=1 Tax=Micromonospora musae TaxID=1894970 RepID=UPI003F4D532A
MTLTDGPAPVVAPRSAPEAERLDATGSAGADEPATIASEPEPVASIPEPEPEPEPEPTTGEFVAAEPTEPVGTEPTGAVGAESADAATPGTEPAVTASSAALPFGALVPPNEPERAAPAQVASTVAESTAVDDERAEPPTRRSPVATPPVRPVAATSVEVDDFRRIQGVGPKMAAALQAAGVRTYRQLADLDEPALRELIRGAGLRAAPGLATWPQQARLLAAAPDEATTALPAPTGASEA